MAPVQPILLSPDVARLVRFYTEVFGAVQTERVPEEGEVFYIGLRIGESDFGVTAVEGIPVGEPVRVLLHIEVVVADATAAKVEAAGGKVLGPANDMPWGQRVAHCQDPDGTTVNVTQKL